jgi:hypothetical protein
MARRGCPQRNRLAHFANLDDSITATIGRRRLVLVRSLLSLIAGNSSHEGRA